MSQDSSSDQLLDPVILGSWIAQRSHIWQMDFLSSKELAEFAHKRGLSWYHEEHINLLWKLGFLKAELIVSNQRVDEPGLVLVGQEQINQDEYEFQYADTRSRQLIQDSTTLSLEEMQTVPSTLKVLFHPFRFSVLQHFERFVPNYEPPRIMYPLMYHLSESLAMWLQWFKPTQEYLQHTQRWNDLVSLVVAAEPCFYERIFLTLRIRRLLGHGGDFDNNFNALREEIERHWNDVASHFQSLDLKRLEQLHQDLCVQTQMLEKNREVHTLLRLGKGKLRLELDGQLGGAMLLRTMA